jgi:hypothetical protein
MFYKPKMNRNFLSFLRITHCMFLRQYAPTSQNNPHSEIPTKAFVEIERLEAAKAISSLHTILHQKSMLFKITLGFLEP